MNFFLMKMQRLIIAGLPLTKYASMQPKTTHDNNAPGQDKKSKQGISSLEELLRVTL